MPAPLHTVTLRNQREVFCTHPVEVPVLHAQVQGYFRHGIAVQAGDWVVDVGANIGMFCLHASDWGQRPLRGLAIEPAPAVAQALTANLARYPMAAPSNQPAGLVPINGALGAAPGQLIFHHYPRATGMSTFFPEELLDTAHCHVMADHLHHLPRGLRWMRHLPRRGRRAVVRLGLWWWFQAEARPCAVHTLSALIEAHQLPRIDLLKVDVECAELEVLRGIAPQHWPLIRQAVLEVHDTQGRLDDVLALLRTHGLSEIATESKGMLRSFGVWQVWARRPECPPA